MSNPIVVRATDLGIWKKCRAMHNYSHVQRLAPKETLQDALFLGVGLHLALEDLYRWKAGELEVPFIPNLILTWKDKLTALGHTEIEPEVKNVSLAVLQGYQQFQEEADAEFVIQSVEEEMEWTFQTSRGPVILRGKCDVRLTENGVPWLMDHKGYKRMPELKTLELDEQMSIYSLLSWKNGKPIAGVIMNVLLKAIPDDIPLVYKGTALSQNKSILTTYELYSAKLDEMGFDRKPYEDFLRMLKERDERTNPFFQRFYVRRTQQQLAVFEKELIQQLEDYVDARTYRSPGLQCAWCKYQELCTAERDGVDTGALLNDSFRTKFDYER